MPEEQINQLEKGCVYFPSQCLHDTDQHHVIQAQGVYFPDLARSEKVPFLCQKKGVYFQLSY